MQRISNILWIATVLIGSASVTACENKDEGSDPSGLGMTGGVGGATAGMGGAAGTMLTGGMGGMTAGMGGAAGTMLTGGTGGMVMTGGVGGMTGGTGGMMAGGMGGMMTGGMGGMTGGTGGMMAGGMGGMMAGGMGGMMTGGMGGGGAATFTEVYGIIEAKCGGTFGCHVMGTSGMLNMQSKMNAFMSLVDVDSEECAGETRVIPGDADNSLIVQAIEGTACTDRMPKGRAALSADEIATIREWIDAGAMND